MKKVLWIIFIAINIFCFFVVASDKRLAENGSYKSSKNNEMRTAEVSLITYAAFGGAVGTLIAFKIYNHKSSAKKKLFAKQFVHDAWVKFHFIRIPF